AHRRILFTTADAMGHVALSFWTARQGFLEKNRAAMVDLLEDYVRSIHWYLDPKNHDEAVKFVSDYTKIPAPIMQEWLFTKDDNYRDPNGLTDIAAVTSNIHAQKELGLIKADLQNPRADHAGMALHQGRQLSRSERADRYRRGDQQHPRAERAGPHQGRSRRQKIRSARPHQGSGRTHQVRRAQSG